VCPGNRIHCCFCANILTALFEYTGFALCIMQGANRVRGRYIFVQMTCNSIHNKSDRIPGALIKCTAQFVFSLSVRPFISEPRRKTGGAKSRHDLQASRETKGRPRTRYAPAKVFKPNLYHIIIVFFSALHQTIITRTHQVWSFYFHAKILCSCHTD
jgi:hypothetical protein